MSLNDDSLNGDNDNTNPPDDDVDNDVDDDLDVKDQIIASAVNDLRKEMGLSRKEFDEDFSDLDVADQYKQLKLAKKLLNKSGKGKKGKGSKNRPIVPLPNQNNQKEYGEGTVTPDGKKSEWRINPRYLLRGDKSKTVY